MKDCTLHHTQDPSMNEGIVSTPIKVPLGISVWRLIRASGVSWRCRMSCSGGYLNPFGPVRVLRKELGLVFRD